MHSLEKKYRSLIRSRTSKAPCYVYLCYSGGPHSAHKIWANIIEEAFNGCIIPLNYWNITKLFTFYYINSKIIVAEGVRPTVFARFYKILRARKTKIISIAHGYPLGARTLTFKDKIIRIFYRTSDGIIAVSWLQKKFIINNFGVLNVPVKVCYPFVDVEAFLPISPSWVSDGYIVFVGALEKIKGADLLGQIITNVRKVMPNAELYVVGKGSLFKELKQEEKQVAGLHILGWQSKDQIKKIFMKSKILIAPSRADTFCVPVLEAMASGIIPIVTRMVGSKIFVQKLDPGLVVQMGVNSIVDKVLGLLQADPNKIKTLSSDAKKIAVQWNSETSRDAVLKTYESFGSH